MTLLIATTNPGKLKEIAAILGRLPITLNTLKDFPAVEVAEETGSTFAENARQKALHYANATGMLTMAEDSGFEVDALNGEPGIYSARYLRPDASYAERFDAIYQSVREKQARSAATNAASSAKARDVTRPKRSCGCHSSARPSCTSTLPMPSSIAAWRRNAAFF